MPTSGTNILKTDYNTAQATLQDILGVGENGYGIPILNSDPVEITQVARARAWNDFISDLNVVHKHISNVSTNTSYFTTGTSVVTASTVSNLLSRVNWLNDASRRYTCHPNQFLNTGTSIANSTSTFFSDSTSTRTLSWGVNTDLITHEVVVSFPSRLTARYYFNMGSYLSFVPYYEGNIISDLDGEWANFIDYLRLPANIYKFDRTKYLAGSDITTYTSGSLTISVLAEISADERTIKFTTSYSNSDSTTVYISPSGSTWTILI